MGGISTSDTCMSDYFDTSDSFGVIMLRGDSWGTTAVFLSLFTNVAATMLIAVRTWYVSALQIMFRTWV